MAAFLAGKAADAKRPPARGGASPNITPTKQPRLLPEEAEGMEGAESASSAVTPADLWIRNLDAAPPAATAPAKGGARGGRGKKVAQDDTQVLTMKASINALQQLRLHHAMLFRTLLGPTSRTAAMLEKAAVAGDNYHKATVGKRGHGLGPPGIHKWTAVMEAMAAEEF